MCPAENPCCAVCGSRLARCLGTGFGSLLTSRFEEGFRLILCRMKSMTRPALQQPCHRGLTHMADNRPKEGTQSESQPES